MPVTLPNYIFAHAQRSLEPLHPDVDPHASHGVHGNTAHACVCVTHVQHLAQLLTLTCER